VTGDRDLGEVRGEFLGVSLGENDLLLAICLIITYSDKQSVKYNVMIDTNTASRPQALPSQHIHKRKFLFWDKRVYTCISTSSTSQVCLLRHLGWFPGFVG
jgi:hypothetical protein